MNTRSMTNGELALTRVFVKGTTALAAAVGSRPRPPRRS